MTPSIQRAFTLVELLTVMGVMAFLAGGLGLALQGGGAGVALESAQSTVASLLAEARVQAIAGQVRTMLVVEADPASENFLRCLHIAVETGNNSGQWRISSPATAVSPGIFVVPGPERIEGVTFQAAADAGGTWPEARRSSLAILPLSSLAAPNGTPIGRFLGMTTPLSTQGGSGTGGGDKLILAVGRRSQTGVNFDQPDRVRGIAVSTYGVPILINDGAGFDF